MQIKVVQFSYSYRLAWVLWNPPKVRVTSGLKLFTEIIYIALETSVQLF